MTMKMGLQLNLGQQLTLTPQLQQAIRLLQLSTLDLNQEIEKNLESNPLLEVETDIKDTNEMTVTQQAISKTETKTDDNTLTETHKDDTSWDEIYPTSSLANNNSDEPNFLENFGSRNYSLAEHLHWQRELTPFTDTDHDIAIALIDSINEEGFLTSNLKELQTGLNQRLKRGADNPIDLDEIEAVLHRIQRFDPIGVGARDLVECLDIQLQQLSADTPWLKEARCVVNQAIELLAQHNYKQIMRETKLSQTALEHAIALIKTLFPKPGHTVSVKLPEYIIPDVIVKKVDAKWVVELNPDAVPRLRINSSYAAMVQRADNSRDNVFLKNNLQEARWFIKSLQSRHETLLRVANSIVQHQRDYFEYGDEAMKPLVLNVIAESLQLHESTISRVTTQKYMHTPRGVFELKYFFSSHVATATGGECSSTAIRAFIKKLVAAENPVKPLSDNKIAQLLKDQGINVARRTIAKYREVLQIPASNERKSLV